MKDQNYDWWLQKYCAELSSKGVDNYIHYLHQRVIVEVKNQTEILDKGFYKVCMLVWKNTIRFYRTENPFEVKE